MITKRIYSKKLSEVDKQHIADMEKQKRDNNVFVAQNKMQASLLHKPREKDGNDKLID